MIYIKRIDTCFLRIPKTGSEALQLFLEQNVVDWNEDIISRPIVSVPNVHNKNLKLAKPALNTDVFFKTGHVNAQFVIDNGICGPNTKFVGVIRNPIEKQISNFIYRVKKGIYTLNGLPMDKVFRMMIREGGGVLWREDYKHTMPQSDFFKYNGEMLPNVEPFLFDTFKEDLYNFMEKNNLEIKHELSVINTTPGNKKQLVNAFCTPEIVELIRSAYTEDFDLYESLVEK